MTEEHVMSDWTLRAFARSRKVDNAFRGTFVGADRIRFDDGDSVIAAKVICAPCNNQWLSEIDNAAARVLRPLVRGQREVDLDGPDQSVVAAWLYKVALILDAAHHGTDSPLGTLREGFMRTRLAAPGCVIYAGPASRPEGIEVGDPPTSIYMWPLGVRPWNGTMRLTVNVVPVDGKPVHQGTPTEIPIPGYQIMVGALWAYLGGQYSPVTPESLQGFVQVWPAREETVTVRAASLKIGG
jgi:hypothetical protein